MINHALLVSAGMTPDEAHSWCAKTTALRQSCGCETGAIFMLAALLLYPLVWYWALSEILRPAWLPILIWLVAAFVAGGVGKLTGLVVSRIRVRLRLRAIRRRVKENALYV